MVCSIHLRIDAAILDGAVSPINGVYVSASIQGDLASFPPLGGSKGLMRMPRGMKKSTGSRSVTGSVGWIARRGESELRVCACPCLKSNYVGRVTSLPPHLMVVAAGQNNARLRKVPIKARLIRERCDRLDR